MNGITFPGLFIRPSYKKRATAKSQKRSDWRSIIECISAEGNALPPTVIFEGKNIQQQWFPNDQRDQAKLQSWRLICTDNSYSNNFVSLEWLHKVFIPLTDPGGQDWRLLVLDGHESHMSDYFLSECQAYRIWIADLPPHSSHITQPLDVSVFSSLKIRYRQFRDDVALVSNADTLSKEDFLMCYYRARMQSFTAQNIRSGWRQSGLWRLDVSIPFDNPRCFKPPSEMIEEIAQETPTNETGTLGCFQTPAGGVDLRKQAQAGPSFQTREQRLVMRKACKALDTKNAKIADMERQVTSLQQSTRRLQPKRRAKVVAQDPNAKFIMMPDVAEARKMLRSTRRVSAM